MRKLWIVLIVLGIIVLGFGSFLFYGWWTVQKQGWGQYEQDPVFQPFVIRLYGDIGGQGYWRTEFDAVNEPFDLTFDNVTIPVKAGRRVVYTMGSDGPAAFKLHAEIANTDFENFKSLYLQSFTFPDTDVKAWEYHNHALRLVRSQYDPEDTTDGYQGTAALGNVFFPEKNIVVTIYFFDTPYYGKPLPAMEQIMEKLVDNVEAGFND